MKGSRLLAAWLVMCGVGCGGNTDVGVTGGDGGGLVDGSSGDGAVTGDAGANGDGAAAGDGAAIGDGGTTLGDASPGSPDGGSPADAGPGGNTQTVACGNTACLIGSQVCCVTQLQNPPPPFSYGCENGTACANPNNTALGCTSAANCPANQVCCISQVQGGNVTTSACATACSNNGAQLCDPNAMPTGCAMNAPCSSANIGDWGLPPSFGTCGGKGN